MGIFIHMEISASVTKEEWEKVYEETLQLIKSMPLADKRKVPIHGIDTVCLVPTKEREETYGWNDEKQKLGWRTIGDYEYMHTAEDYYLPRDLVKDNEVDTDAGDAMYGAFPVYMSYSWKDPKCNRTYSIWGNKTQGEPYHMYLLAVACLIEARLKSKAFIYGDITAGQCRKAVDIANQILEIPIDIPARCDKQRLWNRINNMKLNDNEAFKVFNCFYLGTKDSEYGEYIRSKFTDAAFEDYWKSMFEHYDFNTRGFHDFLHDYMLWGFDLEKLCGYVNINDDNGQPQYELFIKRIMDAKLHHRTKNCDEPLRIDQEESRPYSIATLMGQLFYGSVKNKKVDRYIPIEVLRNILNKVFGSVIDVNAIIDSYLLEESNQSEIHISCDMENEELKKPVNRTHQKSLNRLWI